MDVHDALPSFFEFGSPGFGTSVSFHLHSCVGFPVLQVWAVPHATRFCAPLFLPQPFQRACNRACNTFAKAPGGDTTDRRNHKSSFVGRREIRTFNTTQFFDPTQMEYTLQLFTVKAILRDPNVIK